MSIFLHRAGLIKPAPAPYAPASMVFNGNDEVMTRTWSTSSPAPGATMFTYSLWCKVAQYDINDEAVFFQTINDPTNSQYLRTVIYGGGEGIILTNDAGGVGDFDEDCAISPEYATGVWRHIVLRLDTTQGTAGNRLRIYLDGTLLTADFFTNPGLNSTSNRLFANGFQHQIGAWLNFPSYLSGKIAFIDVLDGVSAAPGDFAFDNGGTWTRKKYTGSYGNYGFSLDGSTGVIGADVSGNNQNFTGVNMDSSNLDTADLPPYTN